MFHSAHHRSSIACSPLPLPLHRPLLSLSLLLCCLLSLLGCTRASPVVATWVHLPVDPSTAPTSGFCDHWVGVDAAHERLILVGGDDGDMTGPQGTWALDYSASFSEPVWRNLSIDTASASSIDSPYVGGGPQGGLVHSPSTQQRDFTAGQAELIVWGGHQLTDPQNPTWFHTAYEATLSGDEATWTDDSAGSVDLPGVAWATSAWGDANQTLLFMYGGTVAPDGVDSADLWLLNLTDSPAVWRNVSALCSGDRPRPLSGSRMQFDPVGDQLVLMGGYSCTSDYASGLGGGTNCFSNSIWLMSLSGSSMYQWTALYDPNPKTPTWPSPRAWHSTVLHGSQLWVFGGQYQDATATVYFLNDVQVFDLSLRAWQAVSVKGATPPVMWSQTSSLVLSPDDGIWHMVNIGGCTNADYYPDVYILKLNTAVTADNCQISGQGINSSIAGQPAYFLIQTRVALNVSNSTVLSKSGERAGHNVLFGDVLSYGVQLDFDVLVIGQVGGISTQVSSSIVELGGGLYNVSYTAFGGVASTCDDVSEPAQVTVSITLGGQYLPDTPFNVPVLPSAYVASQTSVSGETDAVQAKPAYITIQPADTYGNVAQGVLNASLLSVSVDGQALPTSAISTATRGMYEVQYVAPSQSQFVLAVSLDGQPVTGSPFSIQPLANMDISSDEATAMRILAGLASLCLVVAMLFLLYARAVPKVKAASPLFLFLILVGCQLALVGVLLPVAQQPSSRSSVCGAYAYTLSVGFTLAVSSLVVKTWRIARIFDRRKIKVRVITDRSLLVPVAALVTADIVFNSVWLGVDPLLPTDFVSSSNALLHYTACSSDNTLLWYALSFVPKGILLAYGVVLASQVRNVPSAFNESKWIGLAVYNIAFCSVILLAILLLLTGSPASVYVIRSIGVIWCVLVTGGLMLLPKLHGQALVDPVAASSSEHKPEVMLSSHGGGGQLKSYDSAHSTVRALKMAAMAQQGTTYDLMGSPHTHRAAWQHQKSARAAGAIGNTSASATASASSSAKAQHRTLNGSSDFKWSADATGTALTATTTQPLHTSPLRLAAQQPAVDLQSVAGAHEAELLIAQLRQQLSMLRAVVDAITLDTPTHTAHGLALAAHTACTTALSSSAADTATLVATPATAKADEQDSSRRGAEQDALISSAQASISAVSNSATHPLPALSSLAADYLADGPALARSATRRLPSLHANKVRPTVDEEMAAYEAAVLAQLQALGAAEELTATDAALTSDARPALSVLLAHPVCVALLKAELSAAQSVHSLLFVLHCQRYRMLRSARLRRAVAARIYDSFLAPSAPQRLELGEAQLSFVRAAVQHSDERLCVAELLDEAEAEVSGALERALAALAAGGTMQRCTSLLQQLPWHEHWAGALSSR